MYRISGKLVTVVVFGLLSFIHPDLYASKTKAAQLPEVYLRWLNQDVNYLITDAERDAFLRLTTNQDRDTFIDNFWKIRNPDPESPSNAAKDEHYRRLAYANENFGMRGEATGWRTDRGMVYITLGAPKQVSRYLNTKYLRQMEIWFYQSPSPGLPIYFSVIFFKPSISEDYRLYSPYSDRPEKLVASSTAVNDEARAVRMITEDLNAEIARLSLSLLPDEPVDVHEAYPSLQSDILLSKIRNYRNLDENKQVLEHRRSILEGVTHRVLLGEQFSTMDVMATRDAENKASIHYLFRFSHPADFALAQQPDGRAYYSLSVKVALSDSTGKIVYQVDKDLSNYISAEQLAIVREKCFGLRGRIPSDPGKYQLDVEVTNKLTKQSFTQKRVILVPTFNHRLSMSQIMILSTEKPARGATSTLPFTFSGIQLNPIGSDNVAIQPGTPLRLIFQAWEEAAAPESLQGKTLDVTYLIGNISTSVRKQESQTVDRSGFDKNGNLILGKDVATDGLPSGNYRLVVKITNPDTHEVSTQALSFQIIGSDAYPLWTVDVPGNAEPH